METPKEEHELSHSSNKVQKSKPLSESFYHRIYAVLGIALILFALYNVYTLSSFNNALDKKLEEAKEAARPASVQLTVITASSCNDCYDISNIVSAIESSGANITGRAEADFSSGGAKQLIEKYGIEKLPSLIINGEISRIKPSRERQMMEEKDGALVFTGQEPPFVDAATGNVRGKIVLTHIKKEDCEKCLNLTPLISQLAGSGLRFVEQKSISADSSEGRRLLAGYNITKVPTIIMDSEAQLYKNIADAWSQIGSIEKDGSLVMREISPPYYSIKEAKVKGLVSFTAVVDKSCSECYSPYEFHKPILQRMGVAFGEEKSIDALDSDGSSLISRYSIEKIPTIILKGDVEEYPVLVSAWRDVGTKEADGAYVFRKVELAQQAYKDIAANKIVKP